MRHILRFAFCIAALLALAPSIASACGIPFEARITSERALLILDGPRQQLITSVDLSEADPTAAVVFPVPGEPEVDQPPGGDQLFAYLQEATRPTVRREERMVWELNSDETAGGAPSGAVLLGRETIGGYDVARLAADDGAALLGWLSENGYSLPPAAAPILADYAAEGWRFVAVKLADAAPAGSLAPLRFSYSADRPVYPTRFDALGDDSAALDLYVLSSGRSQVDGLETVFAGPSAELDPPPPDALGGLLAGRYLTRLRGEALDPASLSADLTVTAAPDDSPYREVITVYRDVSIVRRAGLLLSVFCIVMLSPMALAIAVGLRRRMDALSPDPEAQPQTKRTRDPRRR
jgi:hypothetical protein